MDKAAVKHIVEGLEGKADKVLSIYTPHKVYSSVGVSQVEFVGESTISFPEQRTVKTFVDIASIGSIAVLNKAEEKKEEITEDQLSERPAPPMAKAAPKPAKKTESNGLDF